MIKNLPRPFAALLGAVLLTSWAAPALAADAANAEDSAILETVHSAYVVGIHIERDPDAIRAGFHEKFVMFIASDDGVRHVTRDGWIARIEEGNAAEPDRPKPNVDARLAVLERTGKAAVVRVEVDRDGEHIYTDYMSLYRFEDGWKIVGKIFESH